MTPHNTYPCAGEDKWIAIAVSSQSEWEALCARYEILPGRAVQSSTDQ
jgi:crotonobetainyl-CoA:carnitine CoA-transferase CaiB-like acyl-CoA transferase